jgi:hypothetical protein
MERLRRYQSLSPAERERVDKNLERWRNMSPEERQKARESMRERRRDDDDRTPGRPRAGNLPGGPNAPGGARPNR